MATSGFSNKAAKVTGNKQLQVDSQDFLKEEAHWGLVIFSNRGGGLVTGNYLSVTIKG